MTSSRLSNEYLDRFCVSHDLTPELAMIVSQAREANALALKARLADEVRYAYRTGQEIADDWPDRYDEVNK